MTRITNDALFYIYIYILCTCIYTHSPQHYRHDGGIYIYISTLTISELLQTLLLYTQRLANRNRAFSFRSGEKGYRSLLSATMARPGLNWPNKTQKFVSNSILTSVVNNHPWAKIRNFNDTLAATLRLHNKHILSLFFSSFFFFFFFWGGGGGQ